MGRAPSDKDKASYLARETEMRRMFLRDEGSRGASYWLDGIQALIEGKVFVPGTTDLNTAAEMMGANFHEFAVSERLFGRAKSRIQIEGVFDTVPFSHDTLWACRKTHLLVACLPISFYEVWCAMTDQFFHTEEPWFAHETEPWSQLKTEAGWQLVRKIPVQCPSNLSWEKQLALLFADEQVPSASVLAQAMLIHYSATGDRLFGDSFVRVSDVDSEGDQVALGDYNEQSGIYVKPLRNTSTSINVGLASCKRSS